MKSRSKTLLKTLGKSNRTVSHKISNTRSTSNKIVNDELVKLLSGNDKNENSLKIDSPPASILMVGLQGSGKTTTSAKLANFKKARKQKGFNGQFRY